MAGESENKTGRGEPEPDSSDPCLSDAAGLNPNPYKLKIIIYFFVRNRKSRFPHRNQNLNLLKVFF